MSIVIFAIDNQSPFNHMLFRSMFAGADTAGQLIPVIGSYKCETEFAYICLREDFNDFVEPNGFCEEQESILEATQCNKQYATLVYEDGTREGIGSMQVVSQSEAAMHDGWTYRPDMNQWFVCKKENPDSVPPPEGWNADYVRVSKEEFAVIERLRSNLQVDNLAQLYE